MLVLHLPQRIGILSSSLTGVAVLQGAPGEPLSAEGLAAMEAFLSAASPRVRLLGGTRFDGCTAPSPEWAAFGSYCFLLPRLELLEAAGCCLLSCTVAWRPACGPAERQESLTACLILARRYCHMIAADHEDGILTCDVHLFWEESGEPCCAAWKRSDCFALTCGLFTWRADVMPQGTSSAQR